MRIAWFTHRYAPVISGAENFGRAIVSRFVADGHHADVFTSDADDLGYFTDRTRARVRAPRVSTIDGARVCRFPVFHRFGQKYAGRLLSYWPSWRARCRYESFMPLLPGIDRVRGPYNAVFAVGFPYTIFAHAAHETARAAGCPLILVPFLHLSTPGDPVNRLYDRPHQARLLRAADLVIVPTNLEAAAVARRGVDPSRVLVLGMGVEHEMVTGGDPSTWRMRLAIPPGRRVIGHLATLHPNKGTIELVMATMVLNAGRDKPVHLILAGQDTPDFSRFAAGLPAESARWLHRVGSLPEDGRADFFAAIDLFAMPSRTDSYGIVFLEAWANGLPVVAAKAGGVAEVVRDGQDGLLVPFGDLERLTDALGSLADDAGRAREIGERGRVRVANGYTWDDRHATLMGRLRDLAPLSQARRDPAHRRASGIRDRPSRVRADRESGGIPAS